jgi:hypothetical protein
MFVLYSVCVVRYRSLWRADPSSRGVLPTVVCVWVWSSEKSEPSAPAVNKQVEEGRTTKTKKQREASVRTNLERQRRTGYYRWKVSNRSWTPTCSKVKEKIDQQLQKNRTCWLTNKTHNNLVQPGNFFPVYRKRELNIYNFFQFCITWHYYIKDVLSVGYVTRSFKIITLRKPLQSQAVLNYVSSYAALRQSHVIYTLYFFYFEWWY